MRLLEGVLESTLVSLLFIIISLWLLLFFFASFLSLSIVHIDTYIDTYIVHLSLGRLFKVEYLTYPLSVSRTTCHLAFGIWQFMK